MSHIIGSRGPGYLLKTMGVGYGGPLLIVMLMIVVELSVDKCSSISPKFGLRWWLNTMHLK